MPKQALTNDEIDACFVVMSQLRPHLVATSFLHQVRTMEGEGYRLAYIEEGAEVVCVAGYRLTTSLFMGKNLYVDDLVTAEKARSSGYGGRMMQWIRALARENDCQYLHLDSGTQRHCAHKFYFRENLAVASYHFSQKLSDD